MAKIRQGFVSNSSSSSFIVGIAEIVDKNKFDAYVKKNNIILGNQNSWPDAYIIDAATISEHDCTNDNYIVMRGDNVVVESFSTSASVRNENYDATYFVVNVSNDEGDSAFWNDEHREMEYDINIDYFCENQRKLYKMFFDANSGLSEEHDVDFGAARNG